MDHQCLPWTVNTAQPPEWTQKAARTLPKWMGLVLNFHPSHLSRKGGLPHSEVTDCQADHTWPIWAAEQIHGLLVSHGHCEFHSKHKKVETQQKATFSIHNSFTLVQCFPFLFFLFYSKPWKTNQKNPLFLKVKPSRQWSQTLK